MTTETKTTPTVEDLQDRIKRILGVLGESSRCSKCGAVIFWCVTKNHKKMPYDPDGVTHWATCPNAKDFRRTSP